MKNFLLASFLISLITGCESRTSDSQVTQVVAKVNGDEITAHQIEGELQRMQMPPTNQQLASKVLSSLIDRQLLVQEAVKLNIDRAPEVMQLLDAARAQIYAQAYLARKVSKKSQATDQEINLFMIEHPEVFSHRKVFTMKDFVFANKPHEEGYSQLQVMVKTVDELKTWLNNHQITFEEVEENIPTEALPKEALSFADKIKIGDLLFMRDDFKIIVRCVTNISEVPLQAVQAKAIASKLVNDHKRQQLMLNEIRRLKKLAKIEILDESLKIDAETLPTQNASSPKDGLKGL